MNATIPKFKQLEIKKMGILYEMADPKNTTRAEVQQLCDELDIKGLTWRGFGNLLWFWKPRNYEEDEESDEESDEEDE